jgi:hypothetical protein
MVVATLSFQSAHVAYADEGGESHEGTNGDSWNHDHQGDHPNDSHGEWNHHHRLDWAVSISPRYYGMNTSSYSPAFTGAGVGAPKSGMVGLDFSFYWTTLTHWQVGVGFGGVNTENDNGASAATYNDNFVGLWLAKDLQLCKDVDIAVGSLFGYGSAEMNVVTTGVSGETDETSFTLEPKIVVDFKISPWFKVGVSGSYVEPLAQSQSIKGNQLTTGNISLHGASGGVEFVFGRFGNNS